MKIEIYTKNKDVEVVINHITKFLIKHQDKKNRVEVKKGNKIDELNHSLSDVNYKQIVNFHIDRNLIESALKHIGKLLKNGIEIRMVFKYSSFGNTILVDYNEIVNFRIMNSKKIHEVVNRLY